MNAEGYYIGDPLEGTFKVSVTAVEGAYNPNLTGVSLRLIGKRSPTDPDEKALFDSARVTAPRCTVAIVSNDGVSLAGTFTIDGAATASLRTYRPSSERPALEVESKTVPVYFALTALYTGATRRKVLGTGVIKLNRDRIEDAK